MAPPTEPTPMVVSLVRKDMGFTDDNNLQNNFSILSHSLFRLDIVALNRFNCFDFGPASEKR